MAGGEAALVEWLRRRLRRDGETLMGDDAAFVREARHWAVSVDQQIEGVHFIAGLDARLVGRRLVAVCLSDLAASGAVPAYAFLTVALPAGYPARRLLGGVLAGCRRHGLELAGGDTAGGADRLSCTLTVLGSRTRGGRWLSRSGARAGDGLWLGGPLAGSALGRHLLAAGASPGPRRIELPRRFEVSERLARAGRRAVRRHLEPVPQLALGERLGRRRRVAAIDVSDGLALDLHRLCRASGVGAELDRAALPLAAGLEPWAALLGLSPEALALAGGEDYVLLFTLPGAVGRAPAPGCTRIGTLTDRAGVRLRTGTTTTPLPPRGWDHLDPE